jgi:hypothetical protein
MVVVAVSVVESRYDSFFSTLVFKSCLWNRMYIVVRGQDFGLIFPQNGGADRLGSKNVLEFNEIMMY